MDNCSCQNCHCGSKSAVASLIIGGALIIAAAIGAGTFYRVKALDNTLSVTGSAKQAVTSDSVKWVSSFSRTVGINDLKTGYTQMAADQKIVNNFLLESGVKAEEIVISPVFLQQNYRYDQNAPKEYILQQNVEVKSLEVQKITALTKNIQKLIDQGLVFSTQSLEYYYSQLPALRVSLLSAAIQDAKARAAKIAESSSSKVGAIKSASIGVVQVLPVNSVDISDYGTYDTSSIDKEVMITVRATFGIR
jgi:hypothetical protein